MCVWDAAQSEQTLPVPENAEGTATAGKSQEKAGTRKNWCVPWSILNSANHVVTPRSTGKG